MYLLFYKPVVSCPKLAELIHFKYVFNLIIFRVYHAWYQFVAFYFWTASCAFFIPYMLFKFFGMSDLKPVIAMLHNPVSYTVEPRTSPLLGNGMARNGGIQQTAVLRFI